MIESCSEFGFVCQLPSGSGIQVRVACNYDQSVAYYVGQA